MIDYREDGSYTDEQFSEIIATPCPQCGAGGQGDFLFCFEIKQGEGIKPAMEIVNPHRERVESAGFGVIHVQDFGPDENGMGVQVVADESAVSETSYGGPRVLRFEPEPVDIEAEVQRRVAEHLAQIQEAHASEVSDAYGSGYSDGLDERRARDGD